MANIIDVPGQFTPREYGVKLAKLSDIDNNVYGPYASVAAAHEALLAIKMNAVGMTVGIIVAPYTIVEYWYQGGTAQANLVEKQQSGENSKDVLPFGLIIDSDIHDIQPSTEKEPTSIVYSSYRKRFIAAVTVPGTLGATYYYVWPNYEQYVDTAKNNAPYGSKVYLCGGKTYVWNGIDLVAGGGEQIQADWNQTNNQAKDFIKNKPTIPTVPTNVSAFNNDANYVDAQALSQAIEGKANASDVYTKSETYNKTELDNMITTPNQEYVTVTATGQTTDVTDLLPATGASDTTYRVGNWDGTQYNDSVFSEYAWNGSTYIKLSTKSQVGEVYDISANHADAKYADLAAALGTNGANIPQSLRKGGMSVKFVQSSDNKYIRCNLIADEFTTDVTKWAIDDVGVYVENPEFAYVKTDGEDKILWAIKIDGSIYYGAGVPQQVIDYIEERIAELSPDEYEDIVAFLNGLEKGDKTLQTLLNEKVDKEEGKSLIDAEYADGVSHIENPEFAAVYLDHDDKILFGIKTDGDFYFGYGVPIQIIDYVNNYITEITASLDTKVDKVTGKSLIDEEVSESMSALEDPEGRTEVTTDSDGKIISYRDSEGVKRENVGIESAMVNTNSLKLTDEGMTEFQQALKDAGFQPGGSGDYTNKDYMYIPEPRLAHLNIIGDVNMLGLSKEGMDGAIEGVNYNVPIQVEFTDEKGNYFLKYALLSGQGRSSLQFLKKGLGMDFFNEDPNSQDFDEDNVFSMKFGDWIPQDSFHIKSFYTDWPRCTTPVVYKLANEVFLTRGVLADRPFKKYYVGEYNEYGGASANTQSDLSKNMETGARCVPDGFPVIVYLNGEFWGVNSWQLKKHRDNYMLNKKKDTNIHLDGDMGTTKGQTTPFWLYDGNIDWTAYCSGVGGIETRNPKNLYCVDGKKYNADTHDIEIIDTATAEAWITSGVITPTGKVIDEELAGYLRTTGKVRKNIEDLTTYVPYIQSLIDGGSSTADIKAAIADRFDVDSFIDYIVIGNVVGNNDAWDNNGQIITWGKLDGSNNLNWSVNVYDCDITFGCVFNGTSASPADGYKLGVNFPLYKFFWDYYYDEMKARYHELRDKGIFNAEHITSLFRSWMNRVGYDNYKKEYNKWPESPCFRDGSQTYINNPTAGGFYGSIERIYLWIKKRIQYMDAASFFDYNN